MLNPYHPYPFESELGSATGHSETSWAIEGDTVLCSKSGMTIKWMRLILLERFKIALKAIPKNVSKKAEHIYGF